MKSNLPVVVVEDDPWTRLIGVVLDPTTSEERQAAFADFMSPDEPDFARWCDDLRARAGGLYPSEVRLVPSQAASPFASTQISCGTLGVFPSPLWFSRWGFPEMEVDCWRFITH